MRFHNSFSSRAAFLAVISGTFAFGGLLLAGCGLTINNPALLNSNPVTPQPGTNGSTSVPVQGYIGGSQWRVSGAAVQLFAMGTSGSGSAATPLGKSVTSDDDGIFSIQSYTCPSADSQLYLTAQGGDASASAGINNQALHLLSYVGPCNQLDASAVYAVNEATTIGTIWPLSGWMTSDTQIGAAPGDSSLPAAVQKVRQLVNLQQGGSPGTGIPSGYAVQALKIDTLASVLHTCVASPGGSSGDGSLCGQLFALTTVPGSLPPANVAEAALHLALNHRLNVPDLYQMTPADAAFKPDLADVPTDWNLDLVPIPAPPVISPDGGVYASGQPVTLSSSGAAIRYTLDGSIPSIYSAIYGNPLNLSSAVTVRAIAFTEEIGSSVASANFTMSAPHLVFSVQPSNATTGAAFDPAISVSILNSNGDLVDTSGAITLQLQGPGGAAALAGTTTASAIHGVANFAGLNVTSAGVGYSLTATSPGMGSALSNLFSVTAPAPLPPPPATASGLVFATQPSNIVAGYSFNPAPAVRVIDSSGNLVTNSTASITLSVIGAGSSLSGTVTVTATNGVASFPGLSIAVPGSGDMLTASSPGLATATSSAFNVTAPTPAPPAPPATAKGLAFATQPSSTVAGNVLNPPPVVQVIDSSGNLVAGSAAAVTLSVTGSSASLSGTVTVTATNGVASFPGLSIAVPGSAYTLTASSNGLANATSNAFNVTSSTTAVPITIEQNAPSQITAAPGSSFQITYNWNASPLATNDTVFVNFVRSDGTIVFQDDHQPPVPTSQWTGPITYTRTVQVPSSAAEGTYRIVAGLDGTSGSLGLTAGPGVTVAGTGQYNTGTLTVAPSCSIASFGAVGDGVTDNAAAIQKAFDYAQQEGCIALVPAGKFSYSGTITATGIAVAGEGAASILAPTDVTNESIILSGSGASLSNLSMVSTAVTRLTTPWSGMVWCENASNYYVENILINNSSSVGIMSYNSHDGYISQNTIENTLADSITQINGSYNIVVNGNRILNSGDDGVSNNSYIGQSLTHDITVTGNNVLNNLWGRGLEVSGGANIDFEANYVNNPDGFSDMYIASETEWSTQGVNAVTVTGNTFLEGGPNQGAVTIYNSQGTIYNITNINVSKNTFFTPPYVALEFVGNGSESGLVVESNTAYSNGTFSALIDPLAVVNLLSNQVLLPSAVVVPTEPAGRGCNFEGC